MKRRVLVAGLLVATVALGATLTTARARQISMEDQARAGYLAAQIQANGAIVHAAADGLRTGELAPYRSASRRLAAQQPPSSLPFWSSGVSSFYDHQADKYRALRVQVKAELRRVTAKTHKWALYHLQKLARQIALADSLDVDSQSARTALTVETQKLRASSLPGQFRGISQALKAPASSLRALIHARRLAVSSILALANNSRDEVVRRADTEVAGAQHQLDLLGLLTSRAETYRAALDRLASVVRTQNTAVAAAVKEISLDQEVAQAAADYAKTVPAKMIVVSTEQQSATMYQDGSVINSSPVTTGGPELPTDHGVFHIYMKVSPFVFHSPWPPGSPYYYPPTPVQFWMPFDGGEGLHDASWRSNFGPGSNLQPTDLGTGNFILGTHGCVNLPFTAAQFVWNWAPIGTTVVVI